MFVNKQKTKFKTPGRISKVRSKLRPLITFITIVIFVFGSGLVAYNKFFKSNKTSVVSGESTEIPAWWYQKYFGKSICEIDLCRAEEDPDGDKLTNKQEYYYHTDPQNDHTIQDEMNDGELVAAGFDPSRKGRMTFDQAASDDNILGESLLLDLDIKKLVAEDMNIDNIILPLVQDDELRIVTDESEESYNRYSDEMKSVTDRYFPDQRIDSIIEIFESGNGAALEDARYRASSLAHDLKKIPVPSKLLLFHKYNIALTQLISDVTDPRAIGSDAWYDKAQALFATQQRLNLEQARLERGL